MSLVFLFFIFFNFLILVFLFFLVAEKLERSNGLTIVFGSVSFYFVIVNLISF